MIKLAMVKVDKILRDGNYRSKMILQVHDELIFDLALDEKDALIPLITEAMETALALPHNVPAKADSGTGNNWLEAH
nr:DNA polymerase [Rubritalea profundi]